MLKETRTVIAPAQLPIDQIVRRVVLAVLISGILLLAPGVEDPGLRRTIPLFGLVIGLQLACVLWPAKVDLASPTAFTGALGLMQTGAMLAQCLYIGRVDLAWIPDVDPVEAAALARTALWLLAIGTILYLWGYSQVSFARRFVPRFPNLAGVEWDRTRFKIIAALCLLPAVASYTYFQMQLGVPLWDPTQLAAGKAVWRNDPTLSWMYRGVQLGLLPAFLLFARAAGQRAAPVRVVVVGGGTVALAYLIVRLGNRGASFQALLTVLVIFNYLYRRVTVSVFAVFLIVAIVFGNVMLQWRQGNVSDTAARYVETESTAGESLITILSEHERERQRLAVLALIVREFPERRDYLYGESWLGLLVTFVPRWLWPEKGEHFRWRDTTMVLDIIGSPNPTPFPALLYANFGWLGVIIGMFFWGVFHRALYLWLMNTPRDPSVVALYAVVLICFSPTLLAVAATVQYVLPIWVALRFMARRSRRVPLAPA